MKLPVVLRVGLSLGSVAVVVAALGSVWRLPRAGAAGCLSLSEININNEGGPTTEASVADRGCDPVDLPGADGCEPPHGVTAGTRVPTCAVGDTAGVGEPTPAPPEVPQLPPAGEVLTVQIEAEQVTVAERPVSE
jgi:hypothetical protein